MFGARNRQWPWLRPGRDHYVIGLQQTVADTDRVRPRESCVARDHLDTTLLHRPGEPRWDVLDQRFLPVDQRGPIEPRLADGNLMDRRALDLVQRMSGRDEDLLRGAAPVWTGAAEIPGLNHRDGQAGAPRRSSHADAGIAATEDHHVEFFWRHGPTSLATRDGGCRASSLRESRRFCYLVVIVDVI